MRHSATYRWCKRHASSLAFAGGFVLDALTLRRIDLPYENTVFVMYLLVAVCGIVLVHAVETGRVSARLWVRNRGWLPVLVQFPIGGLFSGFLIFYTKSASLFTSWFFLTLLVALFVGNELLHRRYERLVFQVTMFYIALLCYLTLVTPVVTGTLGTGTFLMSGVASLFVVALLVQGIMRLFPDVYARSARMLAVSIGGVFLLWNVLYFTNIIPPVPIALKDIGVYHQVVRSGSGYTVRYEPPRWYEPWRDTSGLFHYMPGDTAYCFSAVYAPSRISIAIYHHWLYRPEGGEWVDKGRIPFPIRGGREGGYRGCTAHSDLAEGAWRCVVETESGQVLGEVGFVTEETSRPSGLIEGVR